MGLKQLIDKIFHSRGTIKEPGLSYKTHDRPWPVRLEGYVNVQPFSDLSDKEIQELEKTKILGGHLVETDGRLVDESTQVDTSKYELPHKTAYVLSAKPKKDKLGNRVYEIDIDGRRGYIAYHPRISIRHGFHKGYFTLRFRRIHKNRPWEEEVNDIFRIRKKGDKQGE